MIKSEPYHNMVDDRVVNVKEKIKVTKLESRLSPLHRYYRLRCVTSKPPNLNHLTPGMSSLAIEKDSESQEGQAEKGAWESGVVTTAKRASLVRSRCMYCTVFGAHTYAYLTSH